MFHPVAIDFRKSLQCLPLLLLLMLSARVPALAQGGAGIDITGTGGRHSIQGRIYFPSGLRADSRLKVKLESTRYGEISVLADTNGTFGFRSLLPGSYTVVVVGGDLYETVRETVYIDGEASRPRSGLSLPTAARSFRVQIHLQFKRISEAAGKVGVINAALAGIPESARKAYEKSLVLAQSGDSKKAIEQLKLAISHHAAFPVALNELGVQYIKVGDVDSALASLRSAVKLDPEAFSPRLNYGIALLQKKSFSEAKAQLDVALQRNPNSASAHLYMGITLIHEGKYPEAEQEFQQALTLGKQSMALAHYYLGGLYWRRNEHKLAADELEKYLQAAPATQEAEKIKTTIKELRSKP
jgi:Tfp pilus assembly protein PilF